MTLTPAMLRACLPRANGDVWLTPLNDAMAQFAITTPARMAAFLAQVAHESLECTRLEENLKYSAKRLMAVWPRRFPTTDLAAVYAYQPQRIANRVYANRLGNGDEASDDGWRFRGRGLIQLTGRANYRACGQALLVDLERDPDLLVQPVLAADAAAWFWATRGCNELADQHPEDDETADFDRISVLVNGGRNGLAERQRYWRVARKVIAEPDLLLAASGRVEKSPTT
jgi:putative chitinase